MIANFWKNLNERERWMIGIGSVSALSYLFYFLIYSPLLSAVNIKTQQLIEKKETLAWMEQVRKEIKHQNRGQSLSNTKLLALIGDQLNTKIFQQFNYQLQQIGPGDLQLSFERIPYKLLLSWLWSLNKNYAITIKQFTVDHTDTPGLVKLLLVLAAK